jgi:hypothetical protein
VQVAGLITALTFWARRLVSSAYDGTVQQAQWGLASGTGPRSGRYLHWQRIVVLSRGREGRCFSNNQERPRSHFEANAGQRIGPASPQAGARLSTNGEGLSRDGKESVFKPVSIGAVPPQAGKLRAGSRCRPRSSGRPPGAKGSQMLERFAAFRSSIAVNDQLHCDQGNQPPVDFATCRE